MLTTQASSSESNVKLAEYKEKWKVKTERLVTEVFPAKILEMNDLINSPSFSIERLSDITEELNIPIPDPSACFSGCPEKKRKLEDSTENGCMEGTRVMSFIDGTVHSNRKLVELINLVKPLVREAVEYVNQVKMWILFLIPRIEDGNNFGVSIQEDTLAEVRTVEAEAASFLDQISRYYLSRGKIVSQVAKYPHVEDYRRSVQDLDEKEFLNLRIVLMEVRNHYSTLHNIITENFEKIKKPRSSNLEHLY